jgi:hypothetical protein
MAAPIVHIAKSGSFASSAFTGIESFAITFDGREVTLSTDGSAYLQRSMMFDLNGSVTVQCANIAQTFTPGTTGALVLVGKLKADGSGSSTDRTYTMAHAHLLSVAPNLITNDRSTFTLQFRIYDGDDDGSLATIA